MFLNKTKFKKLLKDAYQNGGLTVGQTEKGILCLHGSGWCMEIPMDFICKEHLAAVIEYTGYIPSAGTAVTFSKLGDQEALLDTCYMNLAQKWSDIAFTGNTYQFTRVIIASNNGYQWLMQNESDKMDKCFMYNLVATMIDPDLVDDENGESRPTFASTRSDCFMYFGNSEMVLAVKKWNPEYYGEQRIAQSLTDTDALYTTTSQDYILG